MDPDLYTSIVNQFKALLTDRNKIIDEYFFSNNTNITFIDVKHQCQDIFTIHVCNFDKVDILTNNLRWSKYKTSILNAYHYHCLKDTTGGSLQVSSLQVSSDLIDTVHNIKEKYGLDEDTLLALERNIVGFATPHTSKYSRPIKLGVSGGNGLDHSRNSSCCSAGTLACLVENNAKQYILSNSHVLVNHEPNIQNNSNSTMVGDKVTQPGSLDYGCDSSLVESNTVATLTAWTALFNGTTASVDIAIAEVVNGQVDPTGEIVGVGRIREVNANSAPLPMLNTVVQKSGRTTGHTYNTVTTINARINVGYSSCNGSNFIVTYNNCFIINSPNNSFGGAGDSGSLICDYDTYAGFIPTPVGQLFAGNSTIIVGQPIRSVLSTIDGLLGTPIGTTKTVSSSDTSNPVDPIITCQTQSTNTVMNFAISVMDANNSFIDSFPYMAACGVSQMDGKYCIVIMTHKDDYLSMNIPDKLDSVDLRIINIGEPIMAMI
jgi:hypothetical protein